jgi:hypothetical protein
VQASHREGPKACGSSGCLLIGITSHMTNLTGSFIAADAAVTSPQLSMPTGLVRS